MVVVTSAYTLVSSHGCTLSLVGVLYRSSINSRYPNNVEGGQRQNMRTRKIGGWSWLDTMHLKRDKL